MKHKLIWASLATLGLVLSAQAQTPAAPSNPTQSSSTNKPTPKAPPAPTKTEPRSSNPEDPHTATTGGADKQQYQNGKKLDDSAGCSTLTDAQSAGIDTSGNSAVRQRADGKRTVCTTSGAEGVGAIDKSKRDKDKQKSAATSSSSTANPR